MPDFLRNFFGKRKKECAKTASGGRKLEKNSGMPSVKPVDAAAMQPADWGLHNAVTEGDLQKVLTLCDQGANPSCFHTNGYSVLMCAVQAYKTTPEKRIAIAKALLKHGADPFYISDDGYQALTMAFDIEVVRLLLNAGVKVTPGIASSLMYRFNGNREIRNLLDNLGIKIDWKDSIRQLYARIREYTGEALYADVLEEAIPLIRDNGLREAAPWKQYDVKRIDSNVEVYFYALHRINEALLYQFQKPVHCGNSGITMEQYVDFWVNVGLTVYEPKEFHPFMCEIYEVHNCEAPTAPILLGSRWPCLLFGEMLFSRASVAVSACGVHLHKQTAENATLYWSHLRADRKYDDLSLGWGHNSQWGTSFRLDYWIGDRLLYNVNHDDEDLDDLDEETIPEERRMELLKYRCCVRAPEVSECFPYDLFAEETYKEKSLVLRPWGECLAAHFE